MNEPVIIEFKCPVCKGEKRLGDELSKKAKEDGWMRKGLNFYTHSLQGVVTDKVLENRRPIGSKTTAYIVYLDVCLDCGCIFAAKIKIAEAVKGLQPPDIGGTKFSGN